MPPALFVQQQIFAIGKGFNSVQLYIMYEKIVLCSIPHHSIVDSIVALLSHFIKVPMKQKNSNCLFERLSKVKKKSVFLFGVSFFILKIFSTFVYYANEGNDDVIGLSAKTVQHSIKNISRNIKAVFLKLGTRNVHHERNETTAVMSQALF